MATRFLAPVFPAPLSTGVEPLFALHREMNRLFDDLLRPISLPSTSGARGATTSAPRLDVQETDDELRVNVDLPGVQPSEVQVRLDGDVLSIVGERKTEAEREPGGFHVIERSYGKFYRSLPTAFRPASSTAC